MFTVFPHYVNVCNKLISLRNKHHENGWCAICSNSEDKAPVSAMLL